MQIPSAPLHRDWSTKISGRVVLFVLIGLGLTCLGCLLFRDGWNSWEPTWQSWGIASRSPCFSDLRGVTGAVTTYLDGQDPALNNPADPWNHLLNHPRLWLWVLGALGIGEGQTEILGLVLIAGLLVGLWWLMKGIGLDAALFTAVIFFSSMTMFAIERCNSDLFLFFLLALAYQLAPRSAAATTVVVLLAFMLKLYPLAGILLLLREPRERALRLGIIAAILVALYLLIQLKDMRNIWSATDKGADVSYGYNVLWNYLRSHESRWTQFVRGISYVVVVSGIVIVWWLHRRPATRAEAAPGRALDAYRIGAGVYAGTFLLGNSWDYRMIFLFFTIPQLFEWLHQDRLSKRAFATSQLLALLIATWSMSLTRQFPENFLAVRSLEELSKWWLYLSCLYQLAHSLPPWARAWVGFRFKSPAESIAATR